MVNLQNAANLAILEKKFFLGGACANCIDSVLGSVMMLHVPEIGHRRSQVSWSHRSQLRFARYSILPDV